MLSLLGSQKSPSTTYDTLSGKVVCSWILDTERSHHMTERHNFLCELKPTLPYTIRLPTGTQATRVQEGHVNLSPNLKIHHVLYILQLQCNLVFVS